MNRTEKKELNVSVRSFVTAIAVIFALMVASYILTLIIPGGSYDRIADSNGNLIIDTASGFSNVDGGIPFWKWLLSPILVLGSSGNGTLIAVIAFLLVIGGIFTALDRCGLMHYMLNKISHRFGAVRYRLMAVITLFFMAMGAMIGSFEECVPLVPIVVALSISLGWDALTGVGMSLLAAGCGFASGVCNPFTVGVAQQLAGLPMFSGSWLRILSFVLIYSLLMAFLVIYSKKTEKPLESIHLGDEFTSDAKMDRALLLFASILGAGILFVLCSGFITALQDYTMIIVAVMFLAAGIVSTLASGMSAKALLKTSFEGVVSILPAVAMILMAASIKYTLEEAQVLDTILHEAVAIAETMPKWSVILFIYLIVLVMNFFIPSGSAKAFMLIPLIVPLAQIFGLSPQLCVVAFAFGDGFSNTFYPTNPALLLSLGLADVSYGKWFKWSWKFQILNLLLTGLILLFGLAVGY
ncbi:MAG: YfcC family protein [Oscillospiraceae bacterium]|nr:YfcC family protein [Oscillospiraceae bacterium]